MVGRGFSAFAFMENSVMASNGDSTKYGRLFPLPEHIQSKTWLKSQLNRRWLKQL